MEMDIDEVDGEVRWRHLKVWMSKILQSAASPDMRLFFSLLFFFKEGAYLT